MWGLLGDFYPLVNVYIAIENGPVEIVDLPNKQMADLSSSQNVSHYQAGFSIPTPLSLARAVNALNCLTLKIREKCPRKVGLTCMVE